MDSPLATGTNAGTVTLTGWGGTVPPSPPTRNATAEPDREVRTLPLADIEWRDSGAGTGDMTVRGHAAVFDRMSLDLGGFRERIAKGAFANALDGNPDVHALWDHDTSLVLARTKNKTLELREDPHGLHFWAKVAPTSYAADLRVLMERGDVDQASFAFTVARDQWDIDENENVTRTILEVDQLYDVTVTAAGAYPQTDTAVVRSLRNRMQTEIERGNLPQEAVDKLEHVAPAPDPVGEPAIAPETLAGGPSSHPVGEDDETRRIASELEARDALTAAVKDRKARFRAELVTAKRRQLDLERT